MRKQRWLGASAALVSLMLVLAACQSSGSPSPSAGGSTPASVAPSAAPKFLACEVTDTGGVDDKGFNAVRGSRGSEAPRPMGIERKFLESKRRPITTRTCGHEGRRLRPDRHRRLPARRRHQGRGAANPQTSSSAIVDFAYDPAIPNVLGRVFAPKQAAILAGYLAAGMTKTGKVGTFGGIKIPPVTDFMNGFAGGHQVLQPAERHHRASCWAGTTPRRTACSPATSTTRTRASSSAENLMDEGADIIMPVAGPVGLGRRRGRQGQAGQNAMIIGVDADQYVTAPGIQGHRADQRPEADGPGGGERRQGRPMAASRAASTSAPSRTAGSASRRSTTSTRQVPADIKDELDAIKAEHHQRQDQGRRLLGLAAGEPGNRTPPASRLVRAT